jgi:hypothetical protein
VVVVLPAVAAGVVGAFVAFAAGVVLAGGCTDGLAGAEVCANKGCATKQPSRSVGRTLSARESCRVRLAVVRIRVIVIIERIEVCAGQDAKLTRMD